MNAISLEVVTASIAIEADKFCSVKVEDAATTSPAFAVDFKLHVSDHL